LGVEGVEQRQPAPALEGTMTAGDVSQGITEVQQTGDLILAAIEGLDPAAEVDAELAGKVLDMSADLAIKAITAWSAASSTPITADSIMALLPNATPLTPPNS
jgi:hypothetical protein